MSPLAAGIDSAIPHITGSLDITDDGPSSSAHVSGNKDLAVASPPVAQKHLNATIAHTIMSLCLSVTLSALDLTIVTTAVPAIISSGA